MRGSLGISNDTAINIPLTDITISTTPPLRPTAHDGSSPLLSTTSSPREIEQTNSPRFSVASSTHSQTAGSTTYRRNNWFAYSLYRYRSISRYYRVMLTLSVFMIIVQLLAIVSVLSSTIYQTCESLFRFYLIASALKLFLYMPLVGIYYLHPDGRNPRFSTSLLLNSVNRSRSILDLFGTILFLIGNYLIFTTEVCASGSPAIYGLALALVIFGYLKIIVPILLCATILCLPCILIILRALRIGEVLDTGANEESIAKLKIVKYHKTSKNPESTGPSTAKNSIEILRAITQSESTSRSNLFTRMLLRVFKRNRSKEKLKAKDLEDREDDITEVANLSEEDATCCICLEEYEDGENLREMRCLHYFHVTCIDEWLKLNRTCPLCKRDIEFNETTDAEDPMPPAATSSL
ncbi:hypothetical protein K7432_005324 [Basidiobolus ranarum]|uniref:RING-type domain-containing protein n=1 Tax=Basidiobolus ranarum TaxID=34480 RepID=A0ABR2WWR9_9FUNG